MTDSPQPQSAPAPELAPATRAPGAYGLPSPTMARRRWVEESSSRHHYSREQDAEGSGYPYHHDSRFHEVQREWQRDLESPPPQQTTRKSRVDHAYLYPESRGRISRHHAEEVAGSPRLEREEFGHREGPRHAEEVQSSQTHPRGVAFSRLLEDELPAPPPPFSSIMQRFYQQGKGDMSALVTILKAKQAEETRLAKLLESRILLLQMHAQRQGLLPPGELPPVDRPTRLLPPHLMAAATQRQTQSPQIQLPSLMMGKSPLSIASPSMIRLPSIDEKISRSPSMDVDGTTATSSSYPSPASFRLPPISELDRFADTASHRRERKDTITSIASSSSIVSPLLETISPPYSSRSSVEVDADDAHAQAHGRRSQGVPEPRLLSPSSSRKRQRAERLELTCDADVEADEREFNSSSSSEKRHVRRRRLERESASPSSQSTTRHLPPLKPTTHREPSARPHAQQPQPKSSPPSSRTMTGLDMLLNAAATTTTTTVSGGYARDPCRPVNVTRARQYVSAA